MMLVKRAISNGASPWTATFLGNMWIALAWLTIAIFRGEFAPVEAWPKAALIGFLYTLGQVLTFLAFEKGDVSVATPVMGSKVLMVALLNAAASGKPVSGRIWFASALATIGIAFVQFSGGTSNASSRIMTIILAGAAALTLCIFDVGLQSWGSDWDSASFLSVAFITAAFYSLLIIPWCDSPGKLKKIKAVHFIVPGTVLMCLQAMSMSFVLSKFGDSIRVNIVYALRGMWGVILVWLLGRWTMSNESKVQPRVMMFRLVGATLLTVAVFVAIAS